MIYLKHTLFYGTLGGIICLSWFLGVYSFGFNPFFSFWGNLVILLVGGNAFFSLYRFAKPLETFSFGQGLLLGGLTVILTGLVACTGIYFATQYFIPNAIEIYKSESLKHLLANKEALIKESSLEIYNTYLKSIPDITVWNSTTRYFTSNMVIPGLMFTILSSLPLRKKSASPQPLSEGEGLS